jgi:hypothetical protein
LRISDVSYIAGSFTPRTPGLSNQLDEGLRIGPGLAGWLGVCDIVPVDAASHYRQLVQLGREEFLASAAPAALVRYRSSFDDQPVSGVHTLTLDRQMEETLPGGRESMTLEADFELFPLTKKPGASFPDRITIGRTGNNDIVISDSSVSRLHAYVRRDGSRWLVADAGSKNGSWLAGESLAARKERPLASRGELRIGDVDLTFFVADDLFAALGGT